jgi:sarcosine/dimethylglycine N-methyltransferase
MGTWVREDDTLQTAMDRTNQVMAEHAGLGEHSVVLDVGCGYGATAIFLAKEYGCHVTGMNISEKELELGRSRAQEAGLAGRIAFDYGDFHDLPYDEASFDIVWSQEAFLHGVDKPRILQECYRVLKPGGQLVLSDLLVREHVPREERERIYARVRSPGMWDLAQYDGALRDAGFIIERIEDWQDNVAPTYRSVLWQLKNQRRHLEGRVPAEQLDSTTEALDLWVRSAHAGKISHGFALAQRPD